MPIVNGVYVNDTLGDAKKAQESVFGSYTKKDMNDYSTAAYNYLMKQQEQAFNLQLWNLQNEYNSPLAQMQRYSEAGLNPNLIYGQQNVASSPASASAPSFRPGGTLNKGIQSGLNAIGQLMNTVKAAVDTYDYWKYGSKMSATELETANWRRGLVAHQGEAQSIENTWNKYLLGLEGAPDYSGSPRGRLYQTQQEAKAAQIDQIRQLIDASLTGQARTDALRELDSYRLKILQGQNSAVLNIHTGLGDNFDGFLKAMIYLAMSKL